MNARLLGAVGFALAICSFASAVNANEPACTTFIDNRGGRLMYVVRQKEPIELFAYVGLPNHVRDEAPKQVEWTLDQAGAAIVPDEKHIGRAAFFPGLQRKLYHITIRATSSSGHPCVPTTLQILVDLDYEQFVAIQMWTGSARDEFSPGTPLRSPSGDARVTAEFSQLSVPLYFSLAASRLTYQHPANTRHAACPAADPGCVTVVAPGLYGPPGAGQQYVPTATLSESVMDMRFGIKAVDPRIYLGAGYVNRAWDAPRRGNLSGVAFVIEKLPDLDQRFTLLGSFAYAPSASGTWTGPDGRRFSVSYTYARYRIGGAYVFFPGKWFLEGGVGEDRGSGRSNAPADFTRAETFVGVGARL
jgi:hypothetical protein